jgi:stage II sporulation protein AA (anti-sigma F factor antagonist)
MSYLAPMTGLRLDVEQDGDATLVRAAGEVDIATAPQLRECIQALAGVVVVDLSGVTFLDSSGINALIGSKNHLSESGGGLRLRGVQPPVRTVLAATGLSDWFEVEEAT